MSFESRQADSGDLSAAHQAKISQLIARLNGVGEGVFNDTIRFILPGAEHPKQQAVKDNLLVRLGEVISRDALEQLETDPVTVDYEIDQELRYHLNVIGTAVPVKARVRQADEFLSDGTRLRITDTEFAADLLQTNGKPISLLVNVIDFTPQFDSSTQPTGLPKLPARLLMLESDDQLPLSV